MKQNIVNKDVYILISEMVKLRELCKAKPKDKSFIAKYEAICEECAKKLDYLVEFRAKKYRKFANYEDLKQDGRLALFMALKSYNPKKLLPADKESVNLFFWWADKYIKTKISREANRHSTIKIPLKKAKNIQPYKVSQLPNIVDVAISPSEHMDKEETFKRLHMAINKLPEEQKRIIELHFEFSKEKESSIINICNKLNITRSNCLKLLDDAKKALKQELINSYY